MKQSQIDALVPRLIRQLLLKRIDRGEAKAELPCLNADAIHRPQPPGSRQNGAYELGGRSRIPLHGSIK
jgi:hypothetical protein